jgi:truncated hemoglobin YjbI
MAQKLPPRDPHARVDGAGLHQVIGGTAAWRRLAVAFYSRVSRDPVLRPLFPGKTLQCAIEEFTAFLAQLFQGPSEDTQRRWWLSLRESHLRFRIGRKERMAWMGNMVKALDDVRIEEPLRSALRDFFDRSSEYIVNTGERVSAAARHSDERPRDSIRREIAGRWEAQCMLDETVTAVRVNEADRVIVMAETVRNRLQPNVFTGLLAQMMKSRNPAMLGYVQERVTRDPSLVRERYAGRTLLHEASAGGHLKMVELLLGLGADPDTPDGGGHTPLYSLANEYTSPDGGNVVRALARGGANVNANEGVKRCTALHMAARRGNSEIAAVLLDCGADIDARDSLGDTPLRRSVNCGQLQVASLLLARGADAHSTGSKGLTPSLAARTTGMKQLLRVWR